MDFFKPAQEAVATRRAPLESIGPCRESAVYPARLDAFESHLGSMIFFTLALLPTVKTMIDQPPAARTPGNETPTTVSLPPTGALSGAVILPSLIAG